jgi:CRISPR-associated protein Csd1
LESLRHLVDLYDRSIDLIGNGNEDNNILLAKHHAVRTAYISVTVSKDSKLFSVEFENKAIMVPVTVFSSVRTSAPSPHILHDKLNYVARDYEERTETKRVPSFFALYIAQLEAFCQSEYGTDNAKIILNYLKNNDLIADIERESGTQMSVKGMMSSLKNFVCFNVLGEKSFWEDDEFIQSWINYVDEIDDRETGIDYITGQSVRLSTNHPSGIRFSGDSAKLISENRTIPFTFQGRFTDASQVVSVGSDQSFKAHSMLKWLIEKQGKVLDGRVFLMWSQEHIDVPMPFITGSKFIKLITGECNKGELHSQETYTKKITEAIQLLKKMYGDDVIHGIVIDSSSKGRLAVLNEFQIPAEVYFSLLENYYLNMVRTYINLDYSWYFDSPGVMHLVDEGSNKPNKQDILGLFHCFIHDQSIPITYINKAVHSMYTGLDYKKMGISLLQNYYGFGSLLDENYQDRSYLFGRMLAIGDQIEKRFNASPAESYAARSLRNFKNAPMTTWKRVYEHIAPFLQKSQGNACHYQYLIEQITNNIAVDDYSDKSLDNTFLIGYYHQEINLIKGVATNGK